jgi:hypothetical protein
MAATNARGPQVMLEGYARAVARGGVGRTMRENIAAMDRLVSAGQVADGNTVDGTSRTGGQPYDVVVAQFPHEPLQAWEIPAPLLQGTTGGNIQGLPYSQPDGSPPVGAKTGDVYINGAPGRGGFLCIAP